MIIVFIRRYNDVDHLTPVVWALAQDSEIDVRVLCMNPFFDIHGDHRVAYLKSLSNVQVGSVYDTYLPSYPYRVAAQVMRKRRQLADKLRRAVIEQFWQHVWLPHVYNVTWAEGLLRDSGAGVLVFDWVKPNQHVTGSLLAAAKRLGIPTISLPHGVNIITGDLRTSAAARDGHITDYARAFPFDWFVAPHWDYAEYFSRGGMPRDRMVVLGSARFCAEWVRQGLQILPPALSLKDSGIGKLKVLFLDRASYWLKPAVAETTLRRLSSLDFVQLVVKPQTRNDRLAVRLENGVQLAPAIPSNQLVAWADVVIGTVSSILIEPLCQGKPLLYPSYHCDVLTRFEELGACWSVKSDDELEDALRRLWKKPTDCPVAQSAVEGFLQEVVYAGLDDRDVLRRYREFILSKCDRRRRIAQGDLCETI